MWEIGEVMRLEGFVFKNSETGSWYAVEIPALGIHTQGKSKKEAYEMAKDAIEGLIDVKGFEVSVVPLDADTFSISANLVWPMLQEVLKRQRQSHGATAKEVVQRLGSNSINSYSRYEQGSSIPSVEKYFELLDAISPDDSPILRMGVPKSMPMAKKKAGIGR